MLITKVRFLKSTAPLLLWFFGMVSAFGQRMESAATITPGEGVGRIFLGQKLDEVHASIGAPKLSDAAIGFELRAGASADPTGTGYCRAIHVFRPGTDPRVMESFGRE
jgi:hypothetical protein